MIDHDQVQPIYTGASALEMYYQPLLYVTDQGCLPFPAVDAAGDVSGGLAASGSPNGGCTSSIGGHRYEWEGIIVWLQGCYVGAPVVSINYSEHSLVGWSNLPAPTLNAIDNFNFGAATPPLNDATFQSNLSAGNSSTLIHNP